MGKKMYLITGIIFEALVLRNYAKNNVSFTWPELIAGGVIDIAAWPVVLLANVIK
ncbi:MAG: hypothetical protein LUE29_09460 [Lachnospiraceae bacterium]|nr:hypothetical protein [Lachnospiraceae bacterium]